MTDFLLLTSLKIGGFTAPRPWKSIAMLGVLAILQIAGGLTLMAFTAGATSNFGIGLTIEGLVDIGRMCLAIYQRRFDVKSYFMQKSVSLGMSLAFAGYGTYKASASFIDEIGLVSWVALKETLKRFGVSTAERATTTAVTQSFNFVKNVATEQIRSPVTLYAKEELKKLFFSRKAQWKTVLAVDQFRGDNYYKDRLLMAANKIIHTKSNGFLLPELGSLDLSGFDDFWKLFSHELSEVEKEVQKFELHLRSWINRQPRKVELKEEEIAEICTILRKKKILQENGSIDIGMLKYTNYRSDIDLYEVRNYTLTELDFGQYTEYKTMIIRACLEYHRASSDDYSSSIANVSRQVASEFAELYHHSVCAMSNVLTEIAENAVNLGVSIGFEQVNVSGSKNATKTNGSTSSQSSDNPANELPFNNSQEGQSVTIEPPKKEHRSRRSNHRSGKHGGRHRHGHKYQRRHGGGFKETKVSSPEIQSHENTAQQSSRSTKLGLYLSTTVTKQVILTKYQFNLMRQLKLKQVSIGEAINRFRYEQVILQDKLLQENVKTVELFIALLISEITPLGEEILPDRLVQRAREIFDIIYVHAPQMAYRTILGELELDESYTSEVAQSLQNHLANYFSFIEERNMKTALTLKGDLDINTAFGKAFDLIQSGQHSELYNLTQSGKLGEGGFIMGSLINGLVSAQDASAKNSMMMKSVLAKLCSQAMEYGAQATKQIAQIELGRQNIVKSVTDAMKERIDELNKSLASIVKNGDKAIQLKLEALEEQDEKKKNEKNNTAEFLQKTMATQAGLLENLILAARETTKTVEVVCGNALFDKSTVIELTNQVTKQIETICSTVKELGTKDASGLEMFFNSITAIAIAKIQQNNTSGNNTGRATVASGSNSAVRPVIEGQAVNDDAPIVEEPAEEARTPRPGL